MGNISEELKTLSDKWKINVKGMGVTSWASTDERDNNKVILVLEFPPNSEYRKYESSLRDLYEKIVEKTKEFVLDYFKDDLKEERKAEDCKNKVALSIKMSIAALVSSKDEFNLEDVVDFVSEQRSYLLGNTLRKSAEEWTRNVEKMGVKISSVKNEKESKFAIKVPDEYKKYEQALKNKFGEIIQDAKALISEDFKISVLEKEKELEHMRFEQMLGEEMHYMLEGLVYSGYEEFAKRESLLSTKYKQLYEIVNIHLEDGVLVDRYGKNVKTA